MKKPAYEELEQKILLLENEREQLKSKVQKYELMQFSIDKAMDRIAWIGPDGRFLYANKAACKEMNYTLQEVLAMTVSDVDPHFPPEKWNKHFQNVKQAGSMRLETQQVDGNGKVHDIEVSANYLQFEGQEFMCSFGKDITIRKQAEKQLLQYKHIIESTKTIIGMINSQYIYQYVNNAYIEAFNKKREKIIGHTVSELLGEELFTEAKPYYERCFSGEEVSFQAWVDLPGWGKRFMDVHYSPYIDSEGAVSAVVVSAHDISKVKQLEEQLQESEETFRVFTENIPASVYIKDEKDIHVYGNKKACESVEVKQEEFIGRTTRDFFPEKLAERLIQEDKKILSGKSPKISIEWQNTETGDKRWRQDIKFPITLHSGKKLLGGVAIDITSIKEKENKLQKAYVEIKHLQQKLEQENIYLREEAKLKYGHEDIVGESSAIKKVKADIEQVAPSNATVLITGETGTGKELVTHSIHKYSQRSNKSLIKINCAALPPTLIEAELFGREKGAYTGALTKQAGRFELADGATLFLDEIGDLPLELQGKILRVLENGEFERLGGHTPLKTDARIIAATNKDLAQEVDQGRFREDLFYRLNVFPINVPPLRERKQDIPMLAWHFIKELNKGMGKTINHVSQSTMDSLQRYPWPGNVRELKNVIERALIVSRNGTLQVDVRNADSPTSAGESLSLDEVNRKHILSVLEKTGWRIRGKKGAAELLRINPQTLDSRLKKLGITRPAHHNYISQS